MKYKYRSLALVLTLSVLTLGCASDPSLSVKKTSEAEVDNTVSVQSETQDISTADFKRAVQSAVQNMIKSGVLDNPGGGRYTVMVSRVANMSKREIDAADVAQKIRSDLAATKKVRVVSGMSKDAAATPEINVSGRITQRTAYVRGRERIEYYLHLNLTEVKSGINLWENVTPVLKRNR